MYASSGDKMISCHKVMYGCEIFIPASMIQCEINAWKSKHIKNWYQLPKYYIQKYLVKKKIEKYEYINKYCQNVSHQ